ncbi:MAG: hypothetical protein HC848_05530 [Limnobacter sp.]|nr:hypothetical protein [Limnobacter sp.]
MNLVVWNKPDLLCASGIVNLASSYSAGAVNQAMITLLFVNHANPEQAFHVNVMMFDSRSSYSVADTLLVDTDINGARKPIVITHLQTQNQQQSSYSSPIPGYGNLLEPFRKGSVSPGNEGSWFLYQPCAVQPYGVGHQYKIRAWLFNNSFELRVAVCAVWPGNIFRQWAWSHWHECWQLLDIPAPLICTKAAMVFLVLQQTV